MPARPKLAIRAGRVQAEQKLQDEGSAMSAGLDTRDPDECLWRLHRVGRYGRGVCTGIEGIQVHTGLIVFQKRKLGRPQG